MEPGGDRSEHGAAPGTDRAGAPLPPGAVLPPAPAPVAARPAPRFSLPEEGPWDALMRRLGLAGDEGRRAGRRAAVLVALSWGPLAIGLLVEWLSGGAVPGPAATLPLHVRLLVALPLLVLAERTTGQLTREVVERFVAADLVAPERRDAFALAVARTRRLLRSEVVELLLAVAALSSFGRESLPLPPAPPTAPAEAVRLWVAWVSLPVVRFLVLRLAWRWAVWGLLLARIALLRPRLVPTHTDNAGGLAFVAHASLALLPVGLAAGAVLAAHWAAPLRSGALQVDALSLPVLVYVVLGVAVLLGPPTVFAPRLFVVRHRALRAYGLVATRAGSQFRREWVERPDGDLLRRPGASTFCDTSSVVDRVHAMRLTPYGWRLAARCGALLLVPLLPLALVVVPFSEIAARLGRMLLG